MEQARATLHGQEVAYVEIPGSGPTFVLVHGVGSSRRTWEQVLPLLADAGAHVIALDLPGHGASSRGRGDFSLSAFANVVRDLLDARGVERAVLVGHSLGGGVAMQFAYQFPSRCAGLVLVASGGLGREASLVLRAASLPGSELVLPLVVHRRTVSAIAWTGRMLAAVPVLGMRPVSDEAVATLRELGDPQIRRSFLATLRQVIDGSGQRVSAIDALASAAGLPTLVVWGDRDAILPLEHGRQAVERMPGARLVVFPGGGHEPHRLDPERFVALLLDATYEPAPRSAGRRAATT